jgi:hypothetical protein
MPDSERISESSPAERKALGKNEEANSRLREWKNFLKSAARWTLDRV